MTNNLVKLTNNMNASGKALDELGYDRIFVEECF